MALAPAAFVLWTRHLRHAPHEPGWADRDRFVLSCGHASMLLYSVLHLTGYDLPLEEIRNFRQWGSKTAGHPEYGHAKGIETTTGPLGQGIANSVGFAMAEERMRADFGAKIVDHRTWVIAGDGCLMEGISHEAIGLAGMQELKNLIVLWDNNGISIDGKVLLADVTDQKERFKAAGWSVHECDGHDPDDIDRAIVEAKSSEWPAMIDCHTHIGFGAPTKQDTKAAHGSPLGPEEIAKVREIYGWTSPPFEIPDHLLRAWREIGAHGQAAHAAWKESFGKLSGAKQAEFERVIAGEAPKKLASALAAFRKKTSEDAPKVATRKSSEMVLEVVNSVMPETLGGSADLTG
jgi:transketolase